MSDGDKSMDVQLICNQLVVTYNKSIGMNPMCHSSPWDDSFDILALHPVKKCKG